MRPGAKLSGEMDRREFVRAIGLGAASLALPRCEKPIFNTETKKSKSNALNH